MLHPLAVRLFISKATLNSGEAQARAPLVLYPVHGQLHGQFPHCSAVDSAHSTLRKGLRSPEGSGPSSGLDTFRCCQFLVRGRKKQIALVAVFGANQSAFAANFHPVSALWTGEPILRLVSHAVPPKPFDAQNKSWTQSIYGPACCLSKKSGLPNFRRREPPLGRIPAIRLGYGLRFRPTDITTRVVKKLERHEMAWLRICTGSLFEWAPPIKEQRLQSRFREVIDHRGIQDALGAPTRLYHRNSESRTPVAKRISGGGEPDPEGADQGSTAVERHWKTLLQRPSPIRFWVGIGSSSRTSLMGRNSVGV
jgi:hypothetical protein